MKRVTKTEYFYNEDEKICHSVTTETSDCNEDCPCAEGELLTSEIDLTEEGIAFSDVAVALAGLGLCLTAVATIFKRR